MRHASGCNRHELSDLTSDLDATQTSFLRSTGFYPWSSMHESLLQQPRNREVLKLEHQDPHGGRSQEWARIGVGVWDSPQIQVAVWEVYLTIPIVYKAGKQATTRRDPSGDHDPTDGHTSTCHPPSRRRQMERDATTAGRWVRFELFSFPLLRQSFLGIWTGFLVCDNIYHPTGFKRRRCHGGESE